MCGLPASGKSKVANILDEQLCSKGYSKVKIIDLDEIRDLNYNEEFTPEHEEIVRKIALDQTGQYLDDKFIVIVDDINYYNSMRRDFKHLADERKAPYIIIYISTPLEICLQWNEKRENPLNVSIIKKISERFDIPGSKYEWDKPFTVLNPLKDGLSEKIAEVTEQLERFLHQTFERKSMEPKKKPIASRKQEIDLILRMFIHTYAEKFFNPNKTSQKLTDKPSYYHKVLEDISDSPLFKKIKLKFTSNIDDLNTHRNTYIKNNKNLLPAVDEDNLRHILEDFMKYLLK